jgi:hypothetical protein
MTSSSVPKQADFSGDEEKWSKILVFLRSNPKLLLKVVPSMPKSKESPPKDKKKHRNLNKDLKDVQPKIRIKSAKYRRKGKT